MDYDKIRQNLVLRSRRKGDYLIVNTDGGKQKLKGHRCILHLKHLQKDYYVYKKGSTYFFTTIKGQCDKTYNLDRENQQKLFWMDYGIDLRQAAIEDRVIFSSYSGYDLIVNYRKNFNL